MWLLIFSLFIIYPYIEYLDQKTDMRNIAKKKKIQVKKSSILRDHIINIIDTWISCEPRPLFCVGAGERWEQYHKFQELSINGKIWLKVRGNVADTNNINFKKFKYFYAIRL